MDTNTGTETHPTPAATPEATPAAVPVATAPETEAAGETMELSMAEHLEQSPELAPGKFARGRVVRVDKEGVLVDVGYKSDGIIRISELSHRFVTDPNEIVKIGDEIDVVVLKLDDAEGNLQLSKKRADLESAWKRVMDAFETGDTLTATAIEQVKGGLIVDLGLRGFLPASQVDLRPVKDLGDYVGEPLGLKVIEIDRGRRKVVLSRKKALEEERSREKQTTLQDLSEGQIIQGRVARLTNFGAFINLGGVDGLVHVSELSYRRIKHPSEVVRIGETVDVLVLKVDKKKERISLSLRQARPDPWLTITDVFKEGAIVKGTVSKLAKNYVFVELAEGVEGLVPLGELSYERVNKPEDVVSVGQAVDVKIIRVQPDMRRIELSLRQTQAAPPSDYRQAGGTGQFTMAQLLKEKFQERGITSLDEHLRDEAARKVSQEAAAAKLAEMQPMAPPPASPLPIPVVPMTPPTPPAPETPVAPPAEPPVAEPPVAEAPVAEAPAAPAPPAPPPMPLNLPTTP